MRALGLSRAKLLGPLLSECTMIDIFGGAIGEPFCWKTVLSRSAGGPDRMIRGVDSKRDN